MSKILILANNDVGLYNFRKELIVELLKDNNVFISLPEGKHVKKLIELGCNFERTPINRRGINPFEDLKLISTYNRLIKRVNPDVILSYTIKPNIYGALAARKRNIPFVANVTGLGSAIEKQGTLRHVLIRLYRQAFVNVETVFFQNKKNEHFFAKNNIAIGKHKLLPGSGVNLEKFEDLIYPPENKTTNFVFIGRVMRDKGIDEYLEAAKHITTRYPNKRFHICGFIEDDSDYQKKLNDYQRRGHVKFHGMVEDIREILKKTHCTIHPSYHEGLSNVLLESAASGRPVLASNIPGCREIFDEGISGFGFEPKNTESLIEAIERFIELDHEEKEKMGKAGRKKVEQEFDRQIVVDAYMDEIEKIVGRE